MDLCEKLQAFLAAHPNAKSGEPMSPTEFGRLYGVPRQNVEHILKGTSRTPTRAEVRTRLAAALGMTVEQLLDNSVSYPLATPHAKGDRVAAPSGKPEFAARLAKAMSERKVTAAKLAARLHVPRGQVDKWLEEHGDMPSAAQVFAIADALPVSPRWLATEVGSISETALAVPLRMPLDAEKYNLLLMFDQLSDHDRQRVIQFAQGLAMTTERAQNVVPLLQAEKSGHRNGK